MLLPVSLLIRTLGRLDLEGAEFPNPKLLLLLTYLSLEGPQPRRRLAELFWPMASDPRNRLSVSLSRIQNALPSMVERRGEAVGTRLNCDAAQVIAAVAAGNHEAAITGYAGGFLDGVDAASVSAELSEWVASTADGIARSVQHAYLHVAEALAGEEQFMSAAAHAQRALLIGGVTLLDPADMARLHTLLVAGGSPEAAEVRAEAAPFDLDLARSRAEARSWLQPRALTPSASDLRTLRLCESLEAPDAELIGRDEELAELARYLNGAERRLITVVGPGGIGKSRIALAAVKELAATDGAGPTIVVVKLESVQTPSQFGAAFAQALGLVLRRGERPLEAVIAYLARGKMLVLLDNFEHLMAVVPTLLELLRKCPGLRLLITSREPLEVRQEWQFRVAGLAYPPVGARHSGASPGGAVESWPAWKLFELRARRVDHRFALDASTVEAVAAICRACHGNPLAIELAASWAGTMSPTQIAEELERNIDLLGTGSATPNASDRHNSFREVFESSWRLLSPGERDLFRRLAVFRGGFELTSAREVVMAELVALRGLVRKSFVIREANGRYRRHPLLMQLALEKLAAEPEEAEELRARHADHLRHLALTSRGHLVNTGDPLWRERIAAEMPNLMAALEWARDKRDASLVLDVIESLGEYWLWRGYAEAVLHWTRVAATLGGRGADPERYLGVITRHIYLCTVTGDYVAALALHDEATELARQIGSLDAEARLWSLRGVISVYQGDYDAARGYYGQALEQATVNDQPTVLARALNNLGDLHSFQGQHAEARQFYVRSLRLERAFGGRQMESNILGSLGMVELRLGDAGIAEMRLRESAATVIKLGIKFSMPIALEQFAALAADVGRWADAARLLSCAEALRETLHLPREPFARTAHYALASLVEWRLGPAAHIEAWNSGKEWRAEGALAWAVKERFVKREGDLSGAVHEQADG